MRDSVTCYPIPNLNNGERPSRVSAHSDRGDSKHKHRIKATLKDKQFSGTRRSGIDLFLSTFHMSLISMDTSVHSASPGSDLTMIDGNTKRIGELCWSDPGRRSETRTRKNNKRNKNFLINTGLRLMKPLLYPHILYPAHLTTDTPIALFPTF